MVTHNPELAQRYSTRIIRMLDGEIRDDSAPLKEEISAEEQAEKAIALGMERICFTDHHDHDVVSDIDFDIGCSG